jgi:hypothetical protein
MHESGQCTSSAVLSAGMPQTTGGVKGKLASLVGSGDP